MLSVKSDICGEKGEKKKRGKNRKKTGKKGRGKRKKKIKKNGNTKKKSDMSKKTRWTVVKKIRQKIN